MVAISSLLCLVTPLLAALSAYAAPPTAEQIEARRALTRYDHALRRAAAPAPAPAPAPARSARDIIASRQYNPHKRRSNNRVFRRALNSETPVPLSVTTSDGVSTMYRFYVGSGFTETDANPTNDDFSPPIQTTFPSSNSAVQVIQLCADYSAARDHYSFQVYFLGSQDLWVCRAYFDPGPTTDASYFNVPNDDVLVAYGFQTTQ